MTVPQFLVLALAVYFAWDALGRVLVAMATALLPGAVRTPVQYAAVLALAYAGYRYAPNYVIWPAALGALVGLIEQLVTTFRHSSERQIQAVQLRRRHGGGPSRFPWP
jgi:hypothetical protein